MAKTLIISGVNYASVALDSVSIVQSEVPCTAISLSANTLTFNDTSSQTLTATVAPVNTTDQVIWSIDDNTVATVSNGVVTPIKSGTATITATCGSYSAECAITANITYDIDASITLGYYYGKQSDSVIISTTSKGAASLVTTGEGRYAYDHNSSVLGGSHSYPLTVLPNCTQISVTVPVQTWKVTFQFVDTTHYSNLGTMVALYVDGDPYAWSADVAVGDRTVNIPSGANGYFITIYANDTTVTQAQYDLVRVIARC